MKNSIILIVALLVSANFTFAAEPAPFGDVIDVSAGDWTFAGDHSDEFEGDVVDTMKWNVDTKDFGVWSWEPENVVQKGGSMHLRMVQQDHQRDKQQLHYKSGMARNEKTITYGYFEARVKGCSRYPGACPSFWLHSIGPNNRFTAKDGEIVAYSEIDVVEMQQSEFDFETKKHFPVTRIDCNLHTVLMKDGKRQWRRPHDSPELCRSFVDADFDPRDDYHVYAVQNTKETIVWYIDGKEVARKPNLYWHLPMHVTLSLGLRYPFVGYEGSERVAVSGKTTGDGFPTHMSVDYVRVWQKPQEASNPDGWSKDGFIAKEKAKWEQNDWPWNQEKVESNFAEIDTNDDGFASGKERQDWFAKKKAEK